MSGGQKQRVSIARALASKPALLLADEPTGALDTASGQEVLKLFCELNDMRNTIVMITHDLNVIRYITDRVAVMYLGRLVECGPTEEVIENPRHPYTRGLMETLPILNPRDRGKKKEMMATEPGSLIHLPEGCHFHPRCPYATPECKERFPENVKITPDYQVACILQRQS